MQKQPPPRSARGSIPVGDTVAHFRVEGTLGEGGMGIVYQADDEHLHRKVALKILHPDVTGNRDRRRRFLREARVAAQVTHPAIATVYEVGEEDGRIFIAMELVDGTSLKTLIQDQGTLSVSEALRIARTVARGLVKAHDAGIIHRDLKPDNVMVASDEIVKILDFGLAKPREKGSAQREVWAGQELEALDDTSSEIATSRWALVGTPSYMSPEQAKGHDVDERSDLFSLGVILYEMLTGKKPFKGETWQEVIISINRDIPPPPSRMRANLPPALDAILARCLDKDADKRYPSCRELIQAIDDVTREIQGLDSGMRMLAAAQELTPLPAPGFAANMAPNTANMPNAANAQPPSAQAGAPMPRTTVAPPEPARAPIAIGLIAGVVVGLGALFGVTRVLRGGATPHGSASAATTASAGPVRDPHAITEFPPPKTENAEAAASYARALQNLRDASISMAEVELRRAAELDPALGAARLRLILYPAMDTTKDERRRYFQDVNQLRESLAPRDEALLKAIEPAVVPDVPDRAEHAKRMSGVAERFATDAEIQLALAQAELDADQTSLAERAVEAALKLDPKLALAGWMKGRIAMAEGSEDGAISAASECLTLSPSAASCFAMRAEIEAMRGDCKAMAEDAKGMAAVEPNGPSPFLWRARALAATGATQATIEEVISGQAKALPERVRVSVDHESRARVGLLYGDFNAAEQHLTQLLENLPPSASEHAHAPMLTLVQLYRESGDAAKATKVAREYLDKRAAWASDDASGVGLALTTVARAAELPRTTVDEQRSAGIAALKAQLPTAKAGAAWSWFYGWPAETPEEARDAVAALPVYSPLPALVSLPELPIADGLMGKVYQIAGKTDDALPLLKRGTQACVAFRFPLEHTQLEYLYGQALEAKGDNTGACGAYKIVLERWGSAKPRSLTAEKARARSSALVCDR